MKFTFVEGEDRGDVRLYTLSSCAWCGKAKDLLDQLGVKYRFVDTRMWKRPSSGYRDSARKRAIF